MLLVSDPGRRGFSLPEYMLCTFAAGFLALVFIAELLSGAFGLHVVKLGCPV